MVNQGFDLQEFAKAARDKSPTGRSAMFAQLARLFWRRGSLMRPKEKVMLAEILRLLRPKTRAETRLELAYEIAGSTLAEPELLRIFAEDTLEVASPVLFAGNRLTLEDLVAIVAEKGAGHGAVIARRKWPEMVTPNVALIDALAALEEPEILRGLLADQALPFSIPALAHAAECARTDIELQELLAARRELAESLAEEMMEWADPRVRETLNARFLFDAQVASAKSPLYGQKVPLPETGLPERLDVDATPALEPIELAPATLIQCLRDGQLALFQAQLAQLAGLRIGLVRKLMGENGGDSLALISRAIDLRRDEFAQIHLLARKLKTKASGIGAADLGQALDFFDRTDAGQARQILARWRQDSAREALTESEDLAPAIATTPPDDS